MYAVVVNNEIQKYLPLDIGFELGGYLYPSNWLRVASAQEKADKNIYPIEHGPRGDETLNTVTANSPVFSNGVVVITYTNTPKPLEYLKPLFKNKLANKRYAVETGGIVINTITIKTDRDSQGMLIGAKVGVDAGVLSSVKWKAENGWTTLTAAQITAIASAVATHIQAAFTRENEISDLIDNATNLEELITIEADEFGIGWPSNE